MANIFDSIKLTKPPRSNFDLSHDVKMSLQMGQLVPTFCEPTVPGDSWSISCDSLLRFAPLVSPVMHRIDVTMHYYFVPCRLLWEKFPDWIYKTVDTPPAFPTLTIDETTNTPLADYLGLPPCPPGGEPEVVSAIPFAAYQMIYQEYYRDQNLIADVPYKLVDGSNQAEVADLMLLRNRAWEHDYFTSALPSAQRGAQVSLPLGDIVLKDPWFGPGGPVQAGGPYPHLTDATQDDIDTVSNVTTGTDGVTGNAQLLAAGQIAAYDPQGTLESASGLINDLRRAYRLQEWLEKSMRGGERPIEASLVHFGVKSSDARLNRPEYITGTKSPVVISEVLSTAETETTPGTTIPQGNMAGHAVSVTQGKYGKYYCEEHGYIIGIMSVMPKTAYFQGIPRHWTKIHDKFEYPWPEFANIGEQEIFIRELYAFTNLGDETFGYIPRYQEYKMANNRVAGDFRNTLLHWHMAREFATPPNLNVEFISSNPTHRIFAVTDPAIQKLYAHILHKIQVVRCLPKHGIPTF